MKRNDPTLYMICGIAMVVLGVVSFIFPALMAGSAAMVAGILLIVGGGASAIAAVSLRSRGNYHVGWLIFTAILDVILGILMIVNPMASVVAIGYILIIYLLMLNLLSIFYSFEVKKLGVSTWGWMLIVGILGTLLALIMLITYSNFDAIVMVGLLVGFYLVLDGIRMIAGGWEG